MNKSRNLLILTPFVLGAVLAWSSPAFAQHSLEEPGGENAEGSRIGVGAETVLIAPFTPAVAVGQSPVGGAAAVSFDEGRFRLDGLLFLTFVENNSTTFALGGRFFYVLHKAKSADFSIGGGLALGFFDPHNNLGGNNQFRVAFEGATQIRAFLTSNVALLATIGLGFSVGDQPFIFTIGGQLIGGLGIVYYF